MYVGSLRFSYCVFLFFIAQERDRDKDLCYFLKAFGTCRYSITEINYNVPITVKSFENFYYCIIINISLFFLNIIIILMPVPCKKKTKIQKQHV